MAFRLVAGTTSCRYKPRFQEVRFLGFTFQVRGVHRDGQKAVFLKIFFLYCLQYLVGKKFFRTKKPVCGVTTNLWSYIVN